MPEIFNLPFVDLILMDMDMQSINSIDLAKALRHKTSKLIFTTAHSQHAYDAFEAEGDAFLLKPFTFAKFTSTITKLFPETVQMLVKQIDRDFFFVKNKNDHSLRSIHYKDIVAVESKLNYVEIHTTKESIITHMPLIEISSYLHTEAGFLKFQRSFIIAQAFIEKIDGFVIFMHGGLKVSVGEHYKKDFNQFVTTKLIKSRRKN